MYVVVRGSFHGGYRVHGPFPSRANAKAWAGSQEWMPGTYWCVEKVLEWEEVPEEPADTSTAEAVLLNDQNREEE